MNRIYLDFNATTPLHPEVAGAMRPFLEEYFGNPSSTHWFGTQARLRVEKARRQIASFLNCAPDELVFTSGGTESNNTALKGIAYAHKDRGKHIITSQIEHPAILEVCKFLEKDGFEISYIAVDESGMLRLDELRAAVRDDSILISIMHANNEVGTIQPIKEISEIARKNNIIFHSDAAQSAGKIALDVNELGVDLLSVAGHKLYGPKGIGVLYIRRGTKIEKLMHGADHERNMRAGTENVIEIIGLGKACELATNESGDRATHMKEMRDMLHKELEEKLQDIYLLGHPEKRLPNTLSIGFAGIEANIILEKLQNDVAVSAGAACHADEVEVSHVLEAMNIPGNKAMGAIRFSTGFTNTAEEILTAANKIIKIVKDIKPEGSMNTDEPRYNKEIKLTQYASGMGCACKIKPQTLEKVLKNIPVFNEPAVLVDLKTSDDASIYKLDDEKAIVESLDFFAPIVDDPYHFGQIAAANALSDIYAMGARPLYALNIVGFPVTRLPIEALEDILKGANNKCAEAGIGILGGHSIDDPEPKFGLVVSGIVHPDKILKNAGAKPGDVLILTKPIGTGIMATAMKKGVCSEKEILKTVGIMATLNKYAAEIMLNYPVSACTDVTGFGLLGHMGEMLKASQVNARINVCDIPFISEAVEYVASGLVPGGTKNNLEYIKSRVKFETNISEEDKLLLADAQTSGGLLISINKEYSEKMLSELNKNNLTKESAVIGSIENKGTGMIYVS